MRLSKEIIRHIVRLANHIKYGRIIIEINETSDKIDVIREERKRFSGLTEKRQG